MLQPIDIAKLIQASAGALRVEVEAMPEALLRFKSGPREWCVKDVVGHLIEAERRGFAGRIRLLLTTAEPALETWDPDDVARARHDVERDVKELLAELAALREGSVKLVAGLQARDLARAGMPAGPEDLAGHRIIHSTSLGAEPAWTFWRGGVPEKHAIAPRYVTNSIDAALWHAGQGGGIAKALAYQAEEAVRSGRLRIVLEAFEPPPLPIQFVYPSARLLSAKVRALVDLALATRSWRFVSLGT